MNPYVFRSLAMAILFAFGALALAFVSGMPARDKQEAGATGAGAAPWLIACLLAAGHAIHFLRYALLAYVEAP